MDACSVTADCVNSTHDSTHDNSQDLSLVARQAQAERLELLRASVYPDAGAEELRLVLAYCEAFDVDPLHKPVYLVPRDHGGWTLLPGIGLYRTVAARSGCAGTSEPVFGPDVSALIGGVQITHPAWCRVSVKRRLTTGEIVEFSATEFWRENYAPLGKSAADGMDPAAPNAMWARRPYGQLAKCAEAQALRKAFPEIGAQPSGEELEGKELGRGERASSGRTAAPAVLHGAPTQVDVPVALPVPTPEAPVAMQAAMVAPSATLPMPQALEFQCALAEVGSLDLVPPDPASGPDGGDQVQATAGERAYLERKIRVARTTVAAARRAAKLAPGDDLRALTSGEFAALRAVLP